MSDMMFGIYSVGVLLMFFLMYRGYSKNGHSDQIGNMLIGALIWPIMLPLVIVSAFIFAVYCLFKGGLR